MGIESSKSIQQQVEELSCLSDIRIKTIWDSISAFQDNNQIIFIGKDLAKLFNFEILRRIPNSEKLTLQINTKESLYKQAFSQATSVKLVIPGNYEASFSRLILLNKLAFISFHIYFDIFSDSLSFWEKEEILKEYGKFLVQENSVEKQSKNEIKDDAQNTGSYEYIHFLDELQEEIKISQIDKIVNYFRKFFNESKDVKNFFSNSQIKKFESKAKNFARNSDVINFKLDRETSVALFNEDYDLIFVNKTNSEIIPEIKYVLNYLANIRYCLMNKNYNKKAIEGNDKLHMILFKIQTFFKDIKDFNPHPGNNISTTACSNKTSIGSKTKPNQDYESDDETNFMSNWELKGFLTLKMNDLEKKYSNIFNEKLLRINRKNRMDVVSFLDEHFSFQKSENDYSLGFPNYGNTCYLNVGMQVMKVLKYDLLWEDLFDFDDETFLNVYIVLRYWTYNTLKQNPENENRIIAHFKCFINGFFKKNNYNDFTYLKCNDSSSFVLNLFNLLVKHSLKIDSLVSDIENKFIDVDECENEETLTEAIDVNLQAVKQLTASRPYLFSIYTYFVTKDSNGNLNCIKPYFDISESVYRKFNKNLKSFFTSRKDTVYVQYPQVLVVKLKIERDRHIFEEVEHYFDVENIKGKKLNYYLKAITFVTGKKSGHTFCCCFYGNNWIEYDDTRIRKLKNLPMDVVYTLTYELQKI